MSKGQWLRGVLIGGAIVLAASFGFSRALRAGAVRRYLIAHLAASFGRPVDVSWFDFSLLDGARIEAHFVSVSDDPRFGNEYFLRSDTLTAGLRWTALLAGRFEFGSVSLSRPSLNLVRDAEGHWNIDQWLPPAAPSAARPGFVGPVVPSREARAARPSRIDVDGGRINFKQADNKIPFALVDVAGRVEQSAAGRWQLDLEARPMRAGVELQDIGTVRLRGSIAGTSARLQPAELNLTWRDASLADALRFMRQDDYGMRGRLAVDLNARIAPPVSSSHSGADSGVAQWTISGVARFTGIHSWRLTERDNDPAVNVSAALAWRLGEPRLEIRNLLVELPASRLAGIGNLDWGRGFRPELHVESSTLALGDMLSWYRALRPEVAEDLRADGVLGLDVKLGGWPIQLQQGAIAGFGGTLTAKALPASLRIGAVNARVSRGGLDFAPTELSFSPATPGAAPGGISAGGDAKNTFVVSGGLFPQTDGVFRWPPDWNVFVNGAASRAQDWLILARTLAEPLNAGWSAAGGLAVKMRGEHRADAPAAPWLGTIDFSTLTLSPAYINQPVRLSKARVEFAPPQLTIALSAAEAFGAGWHGSIARKYGERQWTFDLTADHFDAVELDRWLGPRARPGFLARLRDAASASFAPPPADAIAIQLAAQGRLRAGSIAIAPVHIEQFDGEVELAGRTIRIEKANANFFGGTISGSLEARLLPDPSYEFQGRFDRVDLAQLGRAVPFLNGRIGGKASATLALSTHGIGRGVLAGSMVGQGTLDGRKVALRGFHLAGAFPGNDPNSPDAASEIFSAVQGTYRIQARGIDLTNFVLDGLRGRLEAEGRVDFSHALNVRVHPSILRAATAPDLAPSLNFLLGGTIEAPTLALPAAAPKTAARRASR